MTFQELEKEAAHRLKRAEGPGIPPANPTRRTADFYRQLGKMKRLRTPNHIGPLVESLAVQFRAKLEDASENYRADYHNKFFEMQRLRNEYVLAVEDVKNSAIRQWLAMVERDREEHAAAQAARAEKNDLQTLQQIETAKAELEYHTEDEIVAKLKALAVSDTWDENVIKVYASKGRIARAKVEAMLASQPRNVGIVARDAADEIEALCNSSRGYLPYRTDTLKLWGALDVMELLNPKPKKPRELTAEEVREQKSKALEAQIRTLDKAKKARQKRYMDTALQEVRETHEALTARLEEVDRLRADLQKQLNAQGGNK